MKNIAIIGAGISGLTAADILKNSANITVFEKSRGVSGRMSTRRAEPYFFDHGAQYFKVRTDQFNEFISPLINSGIIKIWNSRYVEFENREIVERYIWDEDDPHYVGVPGMNSIAKHLSRNLRIETGIRVNHITKNQNKWVLEDDNGNNLGEYDWVISTIPAEQASEILPDYLPFFTDVDKINMKSCFALMLGFERGLKLDFDAAIVRDEDVSWISVNSSKPGRNNAFSLLIHSSNDWSDENIDNNPDEVMEHLCSLTTEIIGHDLSNADHKAVHRWRYANIEKQTGNNFFLDADQKIAVCGDWLIEGRVEAAFTSGFELANELLNIINS